VRVVRIGGVPPTPWKNGAGATRELLRLPATGDPLIRISVADVAAAGPFSLFPGIDRVIALLDGAGFRLTGADIAVTLRPGSAPFAFPGDAPVDCELVDGPVRDVNVMTARGAAPWRVDLSVAGTLHGPAYLVSLVAGTLRAADARVQLEPGDLVVLERGERAEPPSVAGALLVVAPR
jgi:uncharacterized protein